MELSKPDRVATELYPALIVYMYIEIEYSKMFRFHSMKVRVLSDSLGTSKSSLSSSHREMSRDQT
jgi:hypothetical protein